MIFLCSWQKPDRSRRLVMMPKSNDYWKLLIGAAWGGIGWGAVGHAQRRDYCRVLPAGTPSLTGMRLPNTNSGGMMVRRFSEGGLGRLVHRASHIPWRISSIVRVDSVQLLEHFCGALILPLTGEGDSLIVVGTHSCVGVRCREPPTSVNHVYLSLLGPVNGAQKQGINATQPLGGATLTLFSLGANCAAPQLETRVGRDTKALVQNWRVRRQLKTVNRHHGNAFNQHTYRWLLLLRWR